jgi:hypothetical protein
LLLVDGLVVSGLHESTTFASVREHIFKIFKRLRKNCTDNNPLTYVTSTAKLDATGHRWLAALGNYNFKIIYKPGRLNGDADGLRRRPHNNAKDEILFTNVIKAVCNAAMVKTQDHPSQKSIRGKCDEPWHRRVEVGMHAIC